MRMRMRNVASPKPLLRSIAHNLSPHPTNLVRASSRHARTMSSAGTGTSTTGTPHMFGDATNSAPRAGAGGAEEIHTAPPVGPAGDSASPPTAGADSASGTNIRITSHNQYTSPRLTKDDLVSDPMEQFSAWFKQASTPESTGDAAPVREPEAMCISTVSPSGFPSSRMVLLRNITPRGWTFFTNYNSRKSRELDASPKVAVCWYWKEVARQVRAVGVVERVERAESEDYFGSRPRGSQIGAWASKQSEVIQEGELEGRVREIEERFEGGDVVCPEGWGGWRIVPSEVEFWAGHSSRLHDRFRYLKQEDGTWQIDRLAP